MQRPHLETKFEISSCTKKFVYIITWLWKPSLNRGQSSDRSLTKSVRKSGRNHGATMSRTYEHHHEILNARSLARFHENELKRRQYHFEALHKGDTKLLQDVGIAIELAPPCQLWRCSRSVFQLPGRKSHQCE